MATVNSAQLCGVRVRNYADILNVAVILRSAGKISEELYGRIAEACFSGALVRALGLGDSAAAVVASLCMLPT